MDASADHIQVEGLESVKRGGNFIPITAYEGKRIPFPDRTFDAVILADVLHHDHDQERLLREAARISRNLVIIKDHIRDGFLAQQRISFLDWAANAGYNVPCLYEYHNAKEWRALVGKYSSRESWKSELRLTYIRRYLTNCWVNLSHYFVVFRVN